MASRVADGAHVEVVGDGTATIRLSDSSVVHLGRTSKAIIHGQQGEARQVVELLQGNGSFDVSQGGGRFRVNTPLGTVTALGTTFTLSLRPLKRTGAKSGLTLAVDVLKGSVRVDHEGRQSILVAGKRHVFGDSDQNDEDGGQKQNGQNGGQGQRGGKGQQQNDDDGQPDDTDDRRGERKKDR